MDAPPRGSGATMSAPGPAADPEVRVDNKALVVLYVLVMVVVIVGLDVAFFRTSEWTWERLAANVGIVLLFGAFYVRLFHPS
jgi:hypothetical protein